MKTLHLLFFALIVCLPLGAQLHDNNWLIGGSCGLINEDFIIKKINFKNNRLKIKSIDKTTIALLITNLSISDANGYLQFYSNGSSIINWQHEIMDNGENLLGRDNCYGVLVPQGMLCLPYPNAPEKYILLYIDAETNEDRSPIYYAIIDMSLNNGKGKVVVKDQLLIDDSLAHGSLTAVKNGNGNGWWILIFKNDAKAYYRISLDHNGLGNVQLIESSLEVQRGFSQANYSPDGSKFSIISNLSVNTGGEFYIWDVNRCDGLLENGQIVAFGPQPSSTIGISFSPSSRFLYTALRDSLYQYDLAATDFLNSKTFISNSIGTDESGLPLNSTFAAMQQGPDGKIYIASAIDRQYLHVINNPNEKGLACDFELFGLDLSSSVFGSIPNNPNYRLGPIDGSPCDTLGLNNNPIANFNYENSNSFEYVFRDLSFYEPRTWSWDFGDGITSLAQNPIHTFSDFGDYEVCLTVSNEYSSHTTCETICVHPAPNFVSYIDATYNILDCIDYPSIDLTATINGIQVDEFENLIVSWIGPDDQLMSMEDEIEITVGGTYILKIEDPTVGCETVDSIFIHENYYPPSFTYSLSSPTLPCEGSVDINLQVDTSCFNTIWRDDQINILFGSPELLSVSEPGLYTVTVRNCETGCGTSQQINIESEVIHAGWTEESNALTVTFTPDQQMNVEHEWFFGDENVSAEINPVHTYTTSGVYNVTHIVSNACGSDTIQSNVQVINTSTNELLTNAIQVFPNPTNNRLHIQSPNMEITQVRLFSSLGQEVVARKVQHMEVEFSVRDFQAGVYWLDVELYDGSSYREKILILEGG